MTSEQGAAFPRGESTRRDAARERLGRVVCGCELRERRGTGSKRHHYYVGVLRDVIDNLWECEHEHPEQDLAHECARTEYARRFTVGGGGGTQPAV